MQFFGKLYEHQMLPEILKDLSFQVLLFPYSLGDELFPSTRFDAREGGKHLSSSFQKVRKKHIHLK